MSAVDNIGNHADDRPNPYAWKPWETADRADRADLRRLRVLPLEARYDYESETTT